ncbi:MAG: serine hydroxymethyltransferase [Candidatus Riflebacteria bacterium]|nr:serine hydroxymethyltransferase [Candidatus Riflebacteria bacterium]
MKVGDFRKALEAVDPEVADILAAEETRQREGLELIASENFVSPAVLEALGSVLTNKYAEGYPAKRYYGGCLQVDRAEELVRQRAKQLFGCEHVNAQPHSGSQANMAVYEAVLKPGDPVLGLSLATGGHLTHGHPVNFSGMRYRFISYGVRRDTETIDYDELAKLALEHKPKMIVTGASAYPRALDFDRFRQIADSAGALLMVDIAHIAGLVATGLHANPCPVADIVTTTTHKTLRGPRGGMIMCKSRLAEVVDKALFPGIQGGPLMHCIASKAVCLKEALEPGFKDYQKQVVANAAALVKGLVARGLRAISGGTDTHLALFDMTTLGLTGKAAEKALEQAGITVNKNTIPFDTQKPFVTSGIRIGSPAVTSRGMKEPEMEKIAGFIHEALSASGAPERLAQIQKNVVEFARSFPLRSGVPGIGF